MNQPVAEIARWLSTAINPLLVILWVFAVVKASSVHVPSRAVSATLVGLALCSGGVFAFRHAHLWSGHPLFPSGHEAFACSLAASIAYFGKRLAVTSALMAGILAPALVVAGYHQWIDVVASILICPVLTIACHYCLRTKSSQYGA